MKDLFYMHIKNKFLKISPEIELLELFTTRSKRHFKIEHILFFLSGKPLYSCSEIAEIKAQWGNQGEKKKSILLAGNSGNFGKFCAQLVLHDQMEVNHCLETSITNRFQGKINQQTSKKPHKQKEHQNTTIKKPQ